MALPACACVVEAPIIDKLDFIYCAALSMTNAGGLVSCECVRSKTMQEKIDAIYCAVFAWAATS